MVSIESFSALDIRVGRIISVEDHEKARKPMFRLCVDFGPEIGVRTIVAGISDVYGKEDIINKKFVFVTNLDPKSIAGVESQGMLLAAGEGSNIALLTLNKDVEEGAKIH